MTSEPPLTPPRERRVLKASRPEDLLAAVPVVLGFEPADSVVALTFGAPDCFHARVDLPTEPGDLEEMTALLLVPARRHRVPSAAFVVYTADAEQGDRAARSLERAFRGAGIDVKALLRADGRQWWLAGDAGGSGGSSGVPYDIETHPFRLQAVVDGQVTHRSRAALAATIAPDLVLARRVARAMGELEELHTPLLEAEEVTACCARHLATGTVLSDAELAAVVRAMTRPDVREAVWARMRREDGPDHVRLWSDAVCRSPTDRVGAVAGVLAFAAWLAGQGALAWCAVDRALVASPGDGLAVLVGDLLAGAVPPAAWTPRLRPGRVAG